MDAVRVAPKTHQTAAELVAHALQARTPHEGLVEDALHRAGVVVHGHHGAPERKGYPRVVDVHHPVSKVGGAQAGVEVGIDVATRGGRWGGGHLRKRVLRTAFVYWCVADVRIAARRSG